MKSNKGITLTSLIIYMIGTLLILGILSTITLFYKKNIQSSTDMTDINIELSKLETRMILETQEAGNKVESVIHNVISFSNGNMYYFMPNGIYMNSVLITTYVEESNVSFSEEGNKQKITIYVNLKKNQAEIVRQLTYIIEKEESNENNLVKVLE